ncbi:hypothetical protein [Roseomonas elaeocarpi]|uniref:Lipoprotein n=1 Tax=Roseomonas elaeocarpi TaxID=907779 RepID=A0ABV6JM38_9PROT
MPRRRPLLLPTSFALASIAASLAGCAFEDARTAARAPSALIGMSELDLQTCLGNPNSSASFGSSKVLTYNSASTSSGGITLTLPLVGGITITGNGYCHVVVRLDGERVSKVRFVGETDEPGAPNAWCAPIVRSCVAHPEPYWSPGPPVPPAISGSAGTTAAPATSDPVGAMVTPGAPAPADQAVVPAGAASFTPAPPAGGSISNP